MTPRLFAVLAAISLLIVVAPPPASALDVVWLSPNGTDSSSCGGSSAPCATLQQAIDRTSTGGTIRALHGTYPATAAEVVDTTLRIEGDWTANQTRATTRDPSRTVFDGDLVGRTLAILGTGGQEPQVTLDGLTLREGAGQPSGSSFAVGGNVWVFDAHLTATDVVIADGVAALGDDTVQGTGGGIAVETSSAGGTTGASATLTRVEVTGNVARRHAGGTGDAGHGYGGGIAVVGSSSFGASSLSLLDSVIGGNAAGTPRGGKDRMWGGGLYVTDAVSVTSEGTTWRNNTARLAGGPQDGFGALGGAVALSSTNGPLGTITFDGDTFEGNVADAAGGTETSDAVQGGAIGARGRSGGTVHLTEVTFTENHAQAVGPNDDRVASAYGGAIAARGPAGLNVELEDVSLRENSATAGGDDGARGRGGALAIQGASLSWNRGTATGNRATVGGDSDTARGGTLYTDDDSGAVGDIGTVEVRNVAVLDDRSATQGGVGEVADVNGVDATFTHVTVAGQRRAGAAAFVHDAGMREPGSIRIANAIAVGTDTVARGLATAPDLVDVESVLVDPGTTVVQNGTQADVIEDDPGFVDAAAGDVHLTEDSPAVDVGHDAGVATDIDGDPRPQGPAPDLGADEAATTAADADGDGVADDQDNCPATPNVGQADADGDGVGDACAPDDPDDGDDAEGPYATGVSRAAADVAADPISLGAALCELVAPEPDSARAVLVARDDEFADALAGASLAGDDACILYTAGGATQPLSTGARTAMDRALAPGGRVILLGGINAVSQTVEDELVTAGYDVTRVAGASRFETASEIARLVLANPQSGPAEALLANAYDFPDAVVGGAYGAHQHAPVLLTAGDSLHPASQQVLTTYRIDDVTVLGGTSVVPQTVVDEVDGHRVAGPNRMGTAVEIARQLWRPVLGDITTYTVVNLGRYGVNGEHPAWTLALASAPLSAKYDAPQIGSYAGALPPETDAHLRSLDQPLALLLIGNDHVVGTQVEDQIRNATGDDAA